MATLLDRAKTLAESMRDLNQLAARRADFEKLRTRANQLDATSKELDASVRSLLLLRKKGVVIDTPPTPSKELRAKSLKLREEFQLNWTSVVGDEQIAIVFLNPVGAHAKKLRDTLSSSWRQHIDGIVPKINEGLITSLRAVLGSQIDRLQGLRRELDDFRSSVPSDENAFLEVERIAGEIKSIWQQLEGVPDKVRAFLMKAAQRQATVDELTPDVREWLEMNSMLKQLRIGFA